jgi:pyridinium-3,5-bisthiocarboxylic acid mononucleotide nickel chelatase
LAKILYFDAYSGLSGDMTLGALLHLGLPFEYLREELARLNLPGYRLEMRPLDQHHINGIKLDVILEQAETEHRSLSIIQALIEASGLPTRVQTRAKKVFQALAEAEGRIHNLPPDAVHFHEVGAVDAIVDIVGACIGFEYFEIDEFYCSPLPVGSGFVRTAHGLLPVPAPATLQLLAQWGAILAPTATLSDGSAYPARAEMLTPTGAALVASLCQPPAVGRPAMSLAGVGYGFGSREFAWPNALRLWLGATSSQPAPETTPTHQYIENHDHSHSHAPGHDHSHPHEVTEAAPDSAEKKTLMSGVK